jgi:hypothetical protein
MTYMLLRMSMPGFGEIPIISDIFKHIANLRARRAAEQAGISEDEVDAEESAFYVRLKETEIKSPADRRISEINAAQSSKLPKRAN